MWVPGPDGDMFHDMRYFWGFVQLQDMVDNAIIEMKTDTDVQDGVFLQQFPYPCFQRNNFLSGLYTIQLLQVMGVYPSVLWLSNFLTLFFVILVDALLVTMVLCLCSLLPKSDPSLVLLLMINYGISIIMFTFLLSVIMKKATSGSVASFLLFILTFLPFLILISLSEEVHIAFRLLCNLSLSTSFGFSFLYITRYEQQGIGLHWDNINLSPLEGDQLNFLYCFLLICLD